MRFRRRKSETAEQAYYRIKELLAEDLEELLAEKARISKPYDLALGRMMAEMEGQSGQCAHTRSLSVYKRECDNGYGRWYTVWDASCRLCGYKKTHHGSPPTATAEW